MTKQSFIKGAMILLVAGIVNRILGFIPRITLPRIIGAEGVGIYQLSYPFLIVLLTFITGGIPLAIAKWIAEAQTRQDYAAVQKIFRTAMTIAVTAALVLTAIMLFFAPYIIKYVIPDERVYQSFLVMSPLLLIIGISSVYRGYFQGLQNMLPNAFAQTLETVLRIIFSLTLAYFLLPYGLHWGAAGAMGGVVVGELGSLIYMYSCYRKQQAIGKHTKTELFSISEEIGPTEELHAHTFKQSKTSITDSSKKNTTTKILGVAIPVTGSRIVGSLSYLLESIFTARSLAIAGIATGLATAQYGALQGMIMPLILLPTALTYSLAVSLVPSLSEAAAQKQYGMIQKRLHQSMKISLVAGAPIAILMFIFATPICELLYAHGEYGPYLKLLAPIGIFIYLQAPLQATLQALDKPGIALFNTLIGATVKIGLIITLASIPSLGIKGAIIAIAANTILVTLLHAFAVWRYIGFSMKLLDIVKVIASMFISGAFALYVWYELLFLQQWLILIISSFTLIIVYLFLMFLTKMIDKSDLIRIPYVGKWFA